MYRGLKQPLVYHHPISGDKTLCIHTGAGFTEAFYSASQNTYTGKQETHQIRLYI